MSFREQITERVKKIESFLQQKGDMSDKERIESLETAVKSMNENINLILKFMEEFNNGKL